MEPRRVRAAGGIVIGDGGTIAMMCNRNGNGAWLFPKGHVEGNESDEETARREIAEETGLIDLEYLDDLGTYERNHILPTGEEDPTELKVIHMFLFAAQPGSQVVPSLEIEHAKWVPYRDVVTESGNAKDRAWFATVFPRVREAVQRD